MVTAHRYVSRRLPDLVPPRPTTSKKTRGMRLSRKNLKSISIGLFFVSLLWGWTQAQEFAWYCRPYGSINYRGDLAPDGLKVIALIQGEEFASDETKDSEYSLAIPKDDPATANKEGWAEGDIITIKVGGFTAVPSFKAFAGSERINLYLPTLDVKLTTWGKIKALFK